MDSQIRKFGAMTATLGASACDNRHRGSAVATDCPTPEPEMPEYPFRTRIMRENAAIFHA
jgi:hypothetical protein